MNGDRGQAEIVGLIIVVMLVVVGFLLFARYVLLRADARGEIAAARETQLGQTFVNSLAQSDVNCSNQFVRVETLVRAHGLGETAACNITRTLNATFARALGTLDAWGVNYRFYLLRRSPTGEFSPVAGFPIYNNTRLPAAQRCSGSMDRSLDHVPVPLYDGYVRGQIEIRLEQCG